MGSTDETKIQKFNCRRYDDYNLRRLRAETALKGKGYWEKLQDVKTCEIDVENKSSALIVAALGETALRVCSSQIGDPVKML